MQESLSPQWLAREFLHYKKGPRTKCDDIAAVAETFEEMIRQGVQPQAILDEIKREARRRTECVWSIENRIMPKNGKPDPIGAAQRWAMKGQANEQG